MMLARHACLAAVLLLCSACGGSAPGAGSTTPPTETTAVEPPAQTSSPSDGTPAEAPKTEAQGASPPSTGAVGAAAVVEEKPLGGAMTQNEIKAVVEKNGDYFNDCYTIGAGKGQQFAAKVTLKVTLGPSGKPSEVLVTNSTAKNPKVDQCVVDGFKKIQFPAPKAGATSVFTFPMEFKGAVEVK